MPTHQGCCCTTASLPSAVGWCGEKWQRRVLDSKLLIGKQSEELLWSSLCCWVSIFTIYLSELSIQRVRGGVGYSRMLHMYHLAVYSRLPREIVFPVSEIVKVILGKPPDGRKRWLFSFYYWLFLKNIMAKCCFFVCL